MLRVYSWEPCKYVSTAVREFVRLDCRVWCRSSRAECRGGSRESSGRAVSYTITFTVKPYGSRSSVTLTAHRHRWRVAYRIMISFIRILAA